MIKPNVYQHWDKLKSCMLGKSYPPEFYSWIKNPNARNAMERVAIETEEDYQSIEKKLNELGVNVIRPEVSGDHTQYYDERYKKFDNAPMTPRDHIGTFGNEVYVRESHSYFKTFYNNIKDPSWPDISNPWEINKLNKQIVNEMYNDFNLEHEIKEHISYKLLNNAQREYSRLLTEHNAEHTLYKGEIVCDNASVTRVGKDLYYPRDVHHNIDDINNFFGDDYRINFYEGDGHSDGRFCPVVPGLIISLNGQLEYEKTFPGWEVIELPDQSWSKLSPFVELKKKNAGKWWVPGQENNIELTTCVEDWLDNWVGYVEETVFDVNMLVVDEKNVICSNENDKVFEAFERYGVTPHVVNFRHRYFWDGGIHCVTADLEREGSMQDYFPNR